jgi:hypothetical protein
MTSENFYKDSEIVRKKNSEYSQIKEELNNLYHRWMEETNKLNSLESELFKT